MNITEGYHVFLNARNRVAGTHVTPVWRLSLPQFQAFRHLDLFVEQVICPYFPDTINEHNNQFYYDEQGGVTTILTIPTGVYDANGLASQLASLIQAAGTNVGIVVTATPQFKYSITNITTPFRVLPVDNSVYDTLGFVEGGTRFSYSTADGLTDAGNFILNNQYVDLMVNYSVRAYNSRSTNHLLARIPLNNVSWSETVFYQSKLYLPTRVTGEGVHELEITLQNEKGELLDAPDNHIISILLHIRPINE